MGLRREFSAGELETARSAAARRQLRPARRLALLGALARQTVMSWAAQEGLEASEEGTFAGDPDLAELLEVSDLLVANRRVEAVPLHGAQGHALRADRLALATGHHSDAYVFVELDEPLHTGRVLGIVPLEAFLERSWLDSTGKHLVVDRSELLDPAELPRILATSAVAPETVPPADHSEAFEALVALETGQVAAQDRAPLEAHVFGCADCRGELIRLRQYKDALINRSAAGAKPERPAAQILAFRPARPSKPFRRLSQVAALIAADAPAAFELETPEGPVKLVVPAEEFQPRIAPGGLAGVLLLADTALSGRQVRIWLLLESEDGERPAPWTATVTGRKLVLEGQLPPEFGRQLTERLGGEPLQLRPDDVQLQLE